MKKFNYSFGSHFTVRAFFLASLSLSLPAQTIPPEKLHAPSPQPDRIILTWAADPATTQAVTWRTDTSVKKALGQIAIDEDGPVFPKRARDVAAETEKLSTNLGDALYHSVKFEGLTPSTRYVYRVGDGDNFSEWATFTTPSNKPEPLEFIYFGDAQVGIYEFWSRVLRASYAAAPGAKFIIHAGDLINTSEKDEQWGEWHRAAGWINQTIPSIPTPGNHEYGKLNTGERGLNRNWLPQFTLPENGVTGLGETNYYYDIQGVRVISLNSNQNQAEQAAWLDHLLQNNPNQWTVLTFHHPIFSTARNRDNKELRELWKPVIDKYGVDLVMTGHDHTYSRSRLIGSESAPKDQGTVYVVSVGGSKMYDLTERDWMYRRAEDTQLYQIIRINGSKLTYEARTARGRLYDAFELEKRSGGKKKLTDRTPTDAENRRPASKQ